MAPHELAARGTALYAPCDDEKTAGREAVRQTAVTTPTD